MRSRTAALLAFLVLPLSACSGGGSPTVLPPLQSTSPTPMQSTQPVAAVTPPASALAHSSSGAAAFLRFYFGRVSAAYAEARPALLDGLADPQCGTCASFRSAAAELAKNHQHIQGVALRLLSAEAAPEQDGYVAVDTYFDAPARKLVDGAGHVVKELPSDTRSHRVTYLQPIRTGWLVRALKAQP